MQLKHGHALESKTFLQKCTSARAFLHGRAFSRFSQLNSFVGAVFRLSSILFFEIFFQAIFEVLFGRLVGTILDLIRSFNSLF